MKILYAVQGTGNGHISRARIMAQAFDVAGIQVDYLLSGREKSAFFDMQAFGDFAHRQGLSFSTKAGELQLFRTIRKCNFRQFFSDIKRLDLSRYDLLLNDYEPVSAWAAKNYGLPSIGLSHQAALSKRLPGESSSLLRHLMINNFAPCQHNIGIHWHHFDRDIVPPVVPFADNSADVDALSYVVYLPFEDLEQIQLLLRDFPEFRFHCFHPHAQNESKGHVRFYALDRICFHQRLAECAGVITNAGFEMSSEAMAMGKKLLVKPLAGQFEQVSNASMLRYLGLGRVMTCLDHDVLEDWLNKGTPVKMRFPTDASPMVDWVMRGEWSNTAPLLNRLWPQGQDSSIARQRQIVSSVNS